MINFPGIATAFVVKRLSSLPFRGSFPPAWEAGVRRRRYRGLCGYENAAKAAKHALNEKITVRQAVIDLGFVDGENLTEEELDKRLNVLSMTNRERDNI